MADFYDAAGPLQAELDTAALDAHGCRSAGPVALAAMSTVDYRCEV